MKMKKMLAVLTVVMLCLTGCAGSGGVSADGVGSGKLQIVTTIFPEYDWVTQILGDNADRAQVTMLMDSGVDLHNFQPSAADILKVSSCDLFIYVGGESDKWAEDALKQAANGDRKVICLMDTLGGAVKEEELVEGMESGEEEGGDEEGPEYDEHVWLSLKNAKTVCGAISEAMAAIDPEHGDEYKANAAKYAEKLDALDGEYSAAVGSAARRTLLFCDRFPFRYMADDYGLEYYAAFSGCSAETEASFETIAFLSGKADELGLQCVMSIEGSDGKIARTVIENASNKDIRILTMDSMQSKTTADIAGGASYLSVMESNLSVLREALS